MRPLRLIRANRCQRQRPKLSRLRVGVVPAPLRAKSPRHHGLRVAAIRAPGKRMRIVQPSEMIAHRAPPAKLHRAHVHASRLALHDSPALASPVYFRPHTSHAPSFPVALGNDSIVFTGPLDCAGFGSAFSWMIRDMKFFALIALFFSGVNNSFRASDCRMVPAAFRATQLHHGFDNRPFNSRLVPSFPLASKAAQTFRSVCQWFQFAHGVCAGRIFGQDSFFLSFFPIGNPIETPLGCPLGCLFLPHRLRAPFLPSVTVFRYAFSRSWL